MKLAGSECWVKGVVWVLIGLTLAPPAVLAQSIPGGGMSSVPVPFGLSPNSQVPLYPGQPIITNTEALQPIARTQTPCPNQSGGAGAAPSMTNPDSLGAGDRLAALGLPQNFGGGRTPGVPAAPGVGIGVPGAGQGQVGSGAGQATPSSVPPLPAGTASAGFGQGEGVGVSSSGSAVPKHPGLLSPLIQGQQDETQGNVGAVKVTPIDPRGDFSIEEAFSRFFLLQGMTNQLKQFGYNFFDQSFSAFPQVMDMPVGPDYVLGPEDTLAIHIWNVPDPGFNRSYIATIERDGMLFIPQVGSVPIAGATFSQAQQIIHGKLSTLLKRFDFHISMGRLRGIKVFVVGEVVRPGAYDLSSLSTVSHALYAACGPARSGSLRHIQVMRAGKVIGDVDLYEFFLRGDRSHDVALRSGDTVLVSPIGPVAAIGGPVRRPAIYELRDRTTLTDLIELAGGLAPSADRRRCKIFRVEAGQKRVILDVGIESLFNGGAKPISGANAPVIIDGDFVQIASVPLQIEQAVTLAGAVRAPGIYELKPGMRLLDIVKPEQLLLDSYTEKAELVRTDPVTYQVSVRPFSIKALLQGQEENVELHRLDKVVVGSQLRGPSIVSVSGEVRRPGSYTLETGERLSSVLKRAGGFTSVAFPEGLVLTRESVRQRQQAEIERFVSLQKQRLTLEAAALSAGAIPDAKGAGQITDAQAVQLQMQALDQMVARIQVGRVVLNIRSLEALENSIDDVVLEASDQITIPVQPKTVSIIGAVWNSTNVLYREELRIQDYLRAAGGLVEQANEDELYIVRANGSTDAGYAKVKTISVGDTIIVPEKVEPKTKALPLWTAIASILGSVGLAIASISIIGK